MAGMGRNAAVVYSSNAAAYEPPPGRKVHGAQAAIRFPVGK